MCLQYLKLPCYHLKIDCYNYKMFCVNLMITTKPKTYNTYKKMKRKESKHTMTENHLITKEERKRETQVYKTARNN